MQLMKILVVLLLCAHHFCAYAQSSVGSRQFGAPNAIEAGVAEIGLEGLWVLSYSRVGDTSAFRTTTRVGPAFRYFVAPNLAVGGKAALVYRRPNEAESDLGGEGLVTIGYFARMGSGLFLAPSAGVGLHITRRRAPIDETTAFESRLVGAVFSASVPLVLYRSGAFKVQGGPEIYAIAGGIVADGVETQSVLDVDAGYSVGIGYVF